MAENVSQTARPDITQRLPMGRRVPRGKRRWYLVHTPEGEEQAMCDKVRRIVPDNILEDAFIIRKECWFKRAGNWFTVEYPMYREYFFAVTSDVRALDNELAQLTFPARIAKPQGRSYTPLSTEAQEWFEGALDDQHVLRNSVGEIVNGVLHVQHGPLVGQEDKLSQLDRRRRRCRVSIADGTNGAFTELVPIDIPFKS